MSRYGITITKQQYKKEWQHGIESLISELMETGNCKLPAGNGYLKIYKERISNARPSTIKKHISKSVHSHRAFHFYKIVYEPIRKNTVKRFVPCAKLKELLEIELINPLKEYKPARLL